MNVDIDVPFLPLDDFSAIAEHFLREYGVWGRVPVPIEEIVEFGLGLDIIPIPGLKQGYGIDAFMAVDLQSITVDEYVYARVENRYRFSLAHETAHLVLHRDLFPPSDEQTIDGYMARVRNMSETAYTRLEWQADELAGQILVPQPQLRERFLEASRMAEQYGLSPNGEALYYIANYLGRQFKVSSKTMEIRIKRDALAM